MSPDWSAKVEPVPYAKLDDPQSLNLYLYMLNNPLSGVDADGHWPGKLIEAWLNVIHVKGGLSLGVGYSYHWGVAKGEAHATWIGVEGSSGLAGADHNAKVYTGVGASASAGPSHASADAGAEVSTKDGASAGASATVSVGPVSDSASATVNRNGGHVSVGPSVSSSKEQDSEIGGSLTGGVTVGASVDISQAERAWHSTAQSFKSLGTYVYNHYLTLPNPSQATSPSPAGSNPFEY
jgi:hypothetical protein